MKKIIYFFIVFIFFELGFLIVNSQSTVYWQKKLQPKNIENPAVRILKSPIENGLIRALISSDTQGKIINKENGYFTIEKNDRTVNLFIMAPQSNITAFQLIDDKDKTIKSLEYSDLKIGDYIRGRSSVIFRRGTEHRIIANFMDVIRK